MIYKILLKEKRRGFEVDFDVVWSTIQVGKEKLNMIENPKYDSRNKVLSVFFEYLRPVLIASKDTG